MHVFGHFCRLLALFAIAATLPSGAFAQSSTWRFEQIYSNADGSVQYVDFVLPPPVIDNEDALSGKTLTAGLNSNSLTFGSNLPSVPVAGQHFLVATPGFAAVAGVTPDYTFSGCPFFNTSGSGRSGNGVAFDSS